MTSMGQSYAAKYVREYTRKNKKNAKRMLGAAADALAQAEILESTGFKSTLVKLRFSDQKPPPTP